MNELFAQLFGQSPSYANALFGEDEAARLRQQAQQQGLLNVGLSLLAGAGPSPQRRGVGQLLAQGVAAGQQAYQGAYDKAMRDRMIQEQLAERQQARAEQQAAQALLPQILRSGATQEIYGEDIMGQRVGEGVRVGQPQIDMNTLQRLLTQAPNVAGKVLPTIEAFRKLNAPERVTLKEGEQVFEMTPEGPRAIAGAPKTREPKFTDVDAGNVIIRYQDGVEIQRIPKGPAPQGPVSLQPIETETGYMAFNPRTGRMEPLMQDGKPVIGKAGKPTEGQAKAAKFAQMMVAANEIVSQPSIASAAPGAGSAIASSVPLVGDSLKNLFQSPETQQYAQAARAWIRAKLRDESGAVIGTEEEANEFRTYFPVTGDSNKVVQQKAEARKRATQGMIESAGKAFVQTQLPEATQSALPAGVRVRKKED
jgi:hypothetical protein